MELVAFAFESILTTMCTILVMALLFVVLVYLVGALTLLVWSLRVGIFKAPIMWLNPIKLIKYSGVITTVSTTDGNYIINYQGLFPRCKFVAK